MEEDAPCANAGIAGWDGDGEFRCTCELDRRMLLRGRMSPSAAGVTMEAPVGKTAAEQACSHEVSAFEMLGPRPAGATALEPPLVRW
mmetsp:Transcript_47731/g.113415  ORF Transcript_47731/g.113415 Transcript_47731/m.113415 type:complete len:87 (-) Transcript_47731:151-411(-)